MDRTYSPLETGMLTGLVLGMVVGVTAFAVTGHVLWIVFPPTVGLVVGVAVGHLRTRSRP